MNMQLLTQYAYAVRYLKAKQLGYRVFYALKKLKIKIPLTAVVLRHWTNRWQAPGFVTSCFSEKGMLHCLNERIDIEKVGCWNDSNYAKLTLYHLHYFDVMQAPYTDFSAASLENLLESWIQNNPPCRGNGWEPYPLSLRIVNWIKWFAKYPNQVKPHWLSSLALQGQALSKQLEFHILGNHLFANAKALAFLGVYFDGIAADRWLQKGLKLLDREISEQFLADGGHFERSPMYHATLLWDMCDLYYLSKQTENPQLKLRQKYWAAVILKGMDWLAAMSHPDGGISFFNDATFEAAPTLLMLRDYIHFLGLEATERVNPLQLLEQTGYCVLEPNKATKLILDVGEVGPDYQPGHAHADTLSFELSVFNQRIIVNSGISQYGLDDVRQFQRSTRAHSTVCINHKNSSDVWAGFRVGRRARPFDLELENETGRIQVACSHNGYTTQPGKNIHRRTWRLSDTTLCIRDTIQGPFQTAQARFYLHPAVQPTVIDKHQIVLDLANQERITFQLESSGTLFLEETCWYPGFAKTQTNRCIVVCFEGSELLTRIVW